MERRLQAEQENKKSPLKIFLIILLILAILATGVVAWAYWYVNSKLDKITEAPAFNADVESFADYDLSCVDVDGFINILVLGVDVRESEDSTEWRSDAIMIASIKEETGEVYLTSLYRDTLLYMPDQGFYDKINHAFTYGGVKEAMKSVNQALDLNIQNYVVINIKGAVEVIDAMDGLDINVEEYEIEELNDYNEETWYYICQRGGACNYVTKPGLQHLDGSQAVTYGRIRKGVGDDYKRTERMRTVCSKLLEKVKTLSFKEIDNVLNVGLPYVKTNLSNSDIMGLAFKVMDFNLAGSTSFPYNIADGYMGAVSYVFPVSLASDVVRLHGEFFGQKNYQPSETCFNISSIISQYYNGSASEPSGEEPVGDGSELGGSSLWTYIPEPEPEPYYVPEPYFEPEEPVEYPIDDPGESPTEPVDPIEGEDPPPIDGGDTGGDTGDETGGGEAPPVDTPVEDPVVVDPPPAEGGGESSEAEASSEG